MRDGGLAVVALAALAVSLSACASSSSPSADTLYGTGTATSTANPMASSSSGVMASRAKATVLTIRKTTIGYVLANAQGDTLYWYSKDVKGSGTSACTGSCLQAWPAVTGKPAAASGIKLNGTLGTITRPGGIVQVTYNGYPLYTYAGDSGPGAIDGNGVGGVWHVITGTALTSSVSSSPGGSGSSGSSSSGGSYGSSSGGSGW
jgi:predicted lipoprotein with Yx(FWY)xxD motif